jgi:glycosyltransferase involved in cell wall biosynthesis
LFKSSDNTIELKKAAIKRSDHLICISQKTKEDLLEFYRISENKVSVVYHGVEKDSFISLPPHPLETKYFLYVGSRAAYKNFDLVLQVFSNYGQDLEDCQLLVFGGGAFSLAEKRRIYELNLEDRVRIESGPDSLLANRYQNAVALIYPSLYEGFGFPPLEAMQYQCPAIVSNASCLPEISGDAALLFDPFSQAALADAMIKVMNDGTLNNQLRELGSQRVKDFSWSRTVLETTRIYHQLVG